MTLIVTQAGLDKVVQADISGISLIIAEVGIGLNGYTPDSTMTALQNESVRAALTGGKQVSSNQIQLQVLLDNENEIVGREVGFYLDDGTLFAIDSDPDDIITYKSASSGSKALETFDLVLDSLPPDSVTVTVTGDLTVHEESSDPHTQYVKKDAQVCTDWNGAITTGFWMSGNAAANAPGTDWFIGTVIVHNSSWLTQTVHQFTLDDSSDAREYRRDMNNGIWGTWRKLLSTEKQIRATACPVGVPLPWPTDVAPIGFAMMKGQAFDTGAYPELYAVFTDGIIPDMRGLAIVGKDDAETVLSYEADEVKSHSHAGTVNSTDLGTKTASSDTHYHTVSNVPRDGAPVNGLDISSSSPSGSYTTRTTSSDTHDHTVSIGSHAHSVTINATGATENTIKNRKFNWIVRLA